MKNSIALKEERADVMTKLEGIKDIWTFEKDMTTNSLVWKLIEVGTD